jgi:hypothetical protein
VAVLGVVWVNVVVVIVVVCTVVLLDVVDIVVFVVDVAVVRVLSVVNVVEVVGSLVWVVMLEIVVEEMSTRCMIFGWYIDLRIFSVAWLDESNDLTELVFRLVVVVVMGSVVVLDWIVVVATVLVVGESSSATLKLTVRFGESVVSRDFS